MPLTADLCHEFNGQHVDAAWQATTATTMAGQYQLFRRELLSDVRRVVRSEMQQVKTRARGRRGAGSEHKRRQWWLQGQQGRMPEKQRRLLQSARQRAVLGFRRLRPDAALCGLFRGLLASWHHSAVRSVFEHGVSEALARRHFMNRALGSALRALRVARAAKSQPQLFPDPHACPFTPAASSPAATPTVTPNNAISGWDCLLPTTL